MAEERGDLRVPTVDLGERADAVRYGGDSPLGIGTVDAAFLCWSSDSTNSLAAFDWAASISAICFSRAFFF